LGRPSIDSKGLTRTYLGAIILVLLTIVSTPLIATLSVRHIPEFVVGRLQLDASSLQSSDSSSGDVKLWVRNVGSASVVLTTVYVGASDGTVVAIQLDPRRVISPRSVELIEFQVVPPLQLQPGKSYVVSCVGPTASLKMTLKAH
jgi:hypothetical protein